MFKKILLLLVLSLTDMQFALAVPLKKMSDNGIYIYFFETPTRYILIDRGKCEGDVGCPGHSGVNYYEMDKKTGRSLMIKNGGTISEPDTYNFKGYLFENNNAYYRLEMMGGDGYCDINNGFCISNKSKNKPLILEELREY